MDIFFHSWSQFSSRMLLLTVLSGLLFWAACSSPSTGTPAAGQLYARLDAIGQDWRAGRFTQAQAAIAILKDSVDRTDTDEALKVLVAVRQVDLQNYYFLSTRHGADTGRQYVDQLNKRLQDGLPDSLKAAIGSVSGFYYFLVTIFGQEQHIDTALRLINASNALYTRLKDKAGQGLTSFYLGLCYSNNPDTTKNDNLLAERYFRQAALLGREAGDKLTQSYASRHLGGFCFDRHQMDSAIFYARESWRYREEGGWRILRPFTISLIGDFYQPLHADSARKYHLLALQSASELGYAHAIPGLRQSVATDDSLLRLRR